MCGGGGGGGGVGGVGRTPPSFQRPELPTFNPEKNRPTNPFEDDVNEIKRPPKQTKPEDKPQGPEILNAAKEKITEMMERVRAIVEGAKRDEKNKPSTPVFTPR